MHTASVFIRFLDSLLKTGLDVPEKGTEKRGRPVRRAPSVSDIFPSPDGNVIRSPPQFVCSHVGMGARVEPELVSLLY